MATGANIQPGRGREVTNLPPQVDVRSNAAQVWGEVQSTAEKLQDGLRPGLVRRAQQLGQQEGADAADGGGPRSRLFDFGQVAAAREEAYQRAYIAGVSNDFDAQEAEIRRANPADPEAYERAMQEVRLGFIRSADPAYAVDIEEYVQRRSQAGFATIADRAASVRLQEADNALVERLGGLEGRALGLIDSGQERTIEFEIIRDEYEQIIRQRAANPALPYSDVEAEADLRDFSLRGQGRAAARYVREIAETEGAVAALDEVARLRNDPEIDPAARPAIVEAASEAANAAISEMQRRQNILSTERAQREAETNRLIDEDVASIQLTGEGTGLTHDQVYAAGGYDAVSRWLRARSDALEFSNLVGALPLNDPDAAAAQISAATAERVNFNTGFGLISDDQDLSTLINAISQVETPGRPDLISQDPDGPGPAAGGAYGDMQFLPSTAETIARQMGIPFDADNPRDLERLRTDVAFGQQLGRQYLTNLLQRYGGDAFLAVTAYHAGEGNTDRWLRAYGDPRTGEVSREAWLDRLQAAGIRYSSEYPRRVLRAMQAGRAGAAWEQYDARRSAAQQDPAAFVQTDFAVRSARERYRENPNSVSAVEDYIGANIAAQERTGIREGDRQTLPGQSLAVWAGALERYARAGDTNGFQELSEQIVRRHGRYGERVLQDALELRGDTRWAAIVSSRAAAYTANGQRPPRAAAADAQSAVRAETINRAASGTARNVSTMSDEELRAAAGL
jgi:hypothetical protein